MSSGLRVWRVPVNGVRSSKLNQRFRWVTTFQFTRFYFKVFLGGGGVNWMDYAFS